MVRVTVPARDSNTAGARTALRTTDSVPNGAPSGTPTSAVAVAEAVAGAVQRVAGVAALSAGRGVEAATYGPGKRVVGVVVERSAATPARLEVHIVVARRHLDPRPTPLRTGGREARQQTDPETAPVLPALADQVRRAAAAAARAAGLTAATIDVFIDDMQ